MSWQRRLAIAMAIGLVCGIYVTMHGWANPDFVSDFDQVWACLLYTSSEPTRP